MSDERKIAEKTVVENFLRDPVIQAALKAIHETYYAEFRAAVSADKRMEAWSRAKALDDFAAALRAVVDTGKVAESNQKRAERSRPPSR